MAIAVDGGLKLPEVLARALGQYRAKRDATVPLRARWLECNARAAQLYAAMYPGDRVGGADAPPESDNLDGQNDPAVMVNPTTTAAPLSVPGGTVMPLA